MRYFLMIFMINSFLTYESITRICKKIKSHKKKLSIFMVLSFSVILLHLCLYHFMSERSYFQIYNLPRNFNQADLKKQYRQMQINYHPDKNIGKPNAEAEYIKMREIYEVLSNPVKKQVYDKYGELSQDRSGPEKEENKDSILLIYAMAEGVLIFVVCFIFGIILTYDENVRPSRKWVMLLTLGAFGLEVYYYLAEYARDADYIDLLLPNIALFQRIEIVRFILGPLANIIRSGYRVFGKGVFDQILEKIEEVKTHQDSIGQLLNLKSSTGGNQGVTQIRKSLDSIEEICTFINTKVQTQLDIRKAGEQKFERMKSWFMWIFFIFIFMSLGSKFTSS